MPSDPTSQPLLMLDRVCVGYPERTTVTKEVSLTVKEGDIACLLGPSGCGKTTLLRAISGFLQPHSGHIAIRGRIVSAPGTLVPPEKRNIGVVFQDYALFPHLSVYGNIAFGLKHLKRSDQTRRVDALLALTGLEGMGHRYMHELSGGQQQRVTLARALAPEPSLVLLDEPFSNLDLELRERLSTDVRNILKRAGTSAVLVTHDQNEAFAMADCVGVMFNGQIAQWDTPYRLYHEPRTPEVAAFVGEGVMIKGERVDGGVMTGLGKIDFPVGQTSTSPAGAPVHVLLRPDDVVHDYDSPLQAKVIRKAFRGADFLYALETRQGEELLALVPSHHNHAQGEWIGIRLNADHVITFPR